MTFGPLGNLASYEDCPFGGLPYNALQRYNSDSEMEPYIRRQSSLLQPTPGVTSRLRDPHLKCDRNLGWNIDWAVAYIVDHLDKKTDAADSLRTVRIKAARLERDGLIKDIPYRIFNKLDETLFAGHLKNAVYLDFHNFDSNVSGATYTQNWSPVTTVKRISIILNQDVLDFATARDMVAILIHHMIHAYFLVACGPQKEDEIEYGRLAHGYHFGKVMTSIKKLSVAHGKELTPLDFSMSLSEYPFFGASYRRPHDRHDNSSDSSEKEKEQWYCSHCHTNVAPIATRDLEKWYDKYIAPMHLYAMQTIQTPSVKIYNTRHHDFEAMHRARLPPCHKTVEFIYNDESHVVETRHVEYDLEIQQLFLSPASRFFRLRSKDETMDDATFLLFMEYIHMPRTSHPAQRQLAPPKPPLLSLDTYYASSTNPRNKDQTPIFHIISLLLFSSSHSLTSLTHHAMTLLATHPILSEDPIPIFALIYAHEPPPELRKWVQYFLARTDSDDMSNLAKLERETWPWRRRWRELVERYGGLENEVRKVREGMLKRDGGDDGGAGVLGLRFGKGGVKRFGGNRFFLTGIGDAGNGHPEPPSANFLANTHVAGLLGNDTLGHVRAAMELEQLKNIHRQQIRDLDREQERLRDKEREKEVAAYLDRVDKGEFRGFVEDEEVRY